MKLQGVEVTSALGETGEGAHPLKHPKAPHHPPQPCARTSVDTAVIGLTSPTTLPLVERESAQIANVTAELSQE